MTSSIYRIFGKLIDEDSYSESSLSIMMSNGFYSEARISENTAKKLSPKFNRTFYTSWKQRLSVSDTAHRFNTLVHYLHTYVFDGDEDIVSIPREMAILEEITEYTTNIYIRIKEKRIMYKKIIGEHLIEEQAIKQFEEALAIDELSIGVLTPDGHLGYGHPIGGVIGYKNKISLQGVGFDIACGNKAVKTNLKSIDREEVAKLIQDKIAFGVGKKSFIDKDNTVLSKIESSHLAEIRNLYPLAEEQLGSVGSGNHFVDLFTDEEGYIWIGVHFGSRGFGHKIASGFMNISQGEEFTANVSNNTPLTLLDVDSTIGQDYFYAMNLAGEYAYAGRNAVVKTIANLIGATIIKEVHNHHNFCWKETHFGEEYYVVRKGATPIFPMQKSFIGATMFDTSVIVEGLDTQENKDCLYSTVHGAGRNLSRRQAKKEINFANTIQKAKSLGIALRGADSDESPEAYKAIDEVLKPQLDTSFKITHKLQPIVVVMAGKKDFDPYKD